MDVLICCLDEQHLSWISYMLFLFLIYPLCLSIHSSPITTTSITKSAKGHIQEGNKAQAKPVAIMLHITPLLLGIERN